MANQSITRKPEWLNKSRMADSLGITTQAFDKWGVTPIAKIGRESFYDVRSVLDNRLVHKGEKQQPLDDEGQPIDPLIEYKQAQQKLRLTTEQADAQEMRNRVKAKKLVPVDFCLFALGKLSAMLGSTLDTIHIKVKRKHPDIEVRHGMEWFSADDQPITTPRSVTFHIWTVYSEFVTWASVVSEWLKVGKDRGKLKTFINTTLGEAWEEDQGEKLEWEVLAKRRSNYLKVPARGVALFGGIDTQDDRYEGRVWAFGAGEEAWLVHRWVLTGDPASVELRKKVGQEIRRQFTREDGTLMRVERWCWDSGGHYSDEVRKESKKHGVTWVIPVFGAATYGKKIATFPKKKTKGDRVYLTEVGTDNAKELIYSRLKIEPDGDRPVPECIHLPLNELVCDEDEMKQLTSERKEWVVSKGRRVQRWTSGRRRNEALDCFVYALAALRISQERFGLDLEQLALEAQFVPATGAWEVPKVPDLNEPEESEPPIESARPEPPSTQADAPGDWHNVESNGWL